MARAWVDTAEALSQWEEAPGGCWRWTGAHGRGGYPTVKIAGKSHYAHRLMFQETNRYLPEHVHHTCGTRDCVNPTHLVPMTAHDHGVEHHPTQEQCKYGHDLTDPANFKVYKSGRRCNECNRIRARERYRNLSPVAKQAELLLRQRQRRMRKSEA